jgi:tetratricopeptide (TPR) repeat protein
LSALHILIVFTILLAIVSLSYNTYPLFAVLIEEKNQDANVKLYFIGTQNNNSLSTNLTSKNVLNYIDKGDELFDEGKYDQAITYYDKALSLDPNDIDTLIIKGVSLNNLDKFEEAIEWYDKALAVDPNYINALYHKAISLDNMGDYEQAIAYFDKALALEPNDVDTLSYKGTSLENLDRHDEAIAYFDKALAIEPSDVDTLNWKGYALYNLDKYDEAIIYFDKVLEIDPNNEYAKNLRALSSTRAPLIDSLFLTSAAEDADETSNATNEFETFRDSKTKVSFQYPSNWDFASDEYIDSIYGDSEGFIVLMVPKSLDGSSMSIIYEELPFSISTKEYVKISEKNIQDDETSVSESIPVSIGSLDGLKYNVTVSDDTSPDGVYVSTQLVFVKNSKAFVITYNLGETERAKDLRDIESMIDSFEINNSNNKDNTENDKAENDDSVPSSNDEELENAKHKAKGLLTDVFNSLFPETGEEFTNSVYGVDMKFPKNWTGVEMKAVFPMAVVAPEGFNFTEVFSAVSNATVDSAAESILSGEMTDFTEQKKQELIELITNKALEHFENMTSTMGIFIYDKEFARLMNSLQQNSTVPVDSLTSIYEGLAASDPTISCDRTSLDQVALHNNMSAELSTEECLYNDSNKKQDNLNYFVLTPNAIVGIQYTSDPNKENDIFLSEFEQALKTLSVKESLPIDNQTIQQFLSG